MTKKVSLISASLIALSSVSQVWAAGPPAGPAVTVTNPPTNPVIVRDNDNAARHPFLYSCTAVGAPPAQCTFPTKAGEETVLEMVSVEVNYASVGPVIIDIDPQVGGQGGIFYMPPIQPTTPTGGFFVGSQALHLYADPNTQIVCEASVPAFLVGEGMGLRCDFTGYTVSLP